MQHTVPFGNCTSKTVKLKPSVLSNPLVNIDLEKNNDLKSDCDKKTDSLPIIERLDSSSQIQSSSVNVSSSLAFVPLNNPLTTSTSSSICSSVNSTSNLLNSPVSISNESKDNESRTSVSSAFVFGQNLHERVTKVNSDLNNSQESSVQNGDTSSEMLFSSAIKQEKQKENSASHEFNNGNAKTLSVSAKEYEEAHAVKRKYEEVEIITGEEEEQNILQINCKLFAFDNASSSWVERGRGTLRVNDKESPEGRTSRLVMRLLGNLRVVLNTKVWADMNVEHVSKKSVRLTAIDNDGQVRIYLIMASPKDSEQLYNVLNNRIQRKKLKTSQIEENSVKKESHGS